ncbi:MAG: AAA family ATPase [Ruminococcus sp.]|nr:AAA family ATPase [Ruminococcus sp.]
MKKVALEAINEQIKSNPKELVDACEKEYNDQITELASLVMSEQSQRPVILLSGPSGSGKTTTALKLEAILDNVGLETHTISMDNYFTPLKIEEGSDLESPERMDIELLQSHIVKIANCEQVEIPLFSFKTQSVNGYRPLKRKNNELIILEGIHALNPDVTGYNDNFTQRVFVGIDSVVEAKDGVTLESSKLRLIRRLVRDLNYRGRSFEETLKSFERVKNGTKNYVMPYKRRASFCINSFLDYELCVFKNIVLNGFEISHTETDRFGICEALQQAEGMSDEIVPADSLIREFIGGSIYSY